MRSLLTACILFCAAPFALAGSATKDPPTDSQFNVTDLCITAVKGANTTLKFTVYDPAPKKTQVCTGSWKTGSGDYPHGNYVICGETSFEWTMASYKSIFNFHMDISHSYKDPSIGPPPYNIITNFALANVTRPHIKCQRVGGTRTCAQPAANTITADIYAVIA